MTFADFIAVAFGPVVVGLALSLRAARAPDLRKWLAGSTIAVWVAYLLLAIAYHDCSIFAVLDLMLFVLGIGVAGVWFGFRQQFHSESKPVEQLKASAKILLGALVTIIAVTILFYDFALPRDVRKGRVQNVRIRGYRYPEHVADIDGRTVRVTTPIYERLKSLPVVRVEVGQGTDYVYKIDYLAN
jgi:hypothetical protein